jgi:hypothetical protein
MAISNSPGLPRVLYALQTPDGVAWDCLKESISADSRATIRRIPTAISASLAAAQIIIPNDQTQSLNGCKSPTPRAGALLTCRARVLNRERMRAQGPGQSGSSRSCSDSKPSVKRRRGSRGRENPLRHTDLLQFTVWRKNERSAPLGFLGFSGTPTRKYLEDSPLENESSSRFVSKNNA